MAVPSVATSGVLRQWMNSIVQQKSTKVGVRLEAAM